jgi:hypothetical protein
VLKDEAVVFGAAPYEDPVGPALDVEFDEG